MSRHSARDSQLSGSMSSKRAQRGATVDAGPGQLVSAVLPGGRWWSGRGRVVVVLAVVVLVSGSRCGPTGDDVVQGLETAVRQARVVDEVPTLRQQGALEDISEELAQARNAAPDSGSSEFAAAIKRAAETQAAVDRMRAVQSSAISNLESLSADIDVVAQRSTKYQDVRRHLAHSAEDVVKDVACGLSWDALKPQEQGRIQDSLDAGEVGLSYRDELTSTTSEAVGDHLYKRAARIFGSQVAEIVDWDFYLENLFEVAGDLIVDDGEVITAPDWSSSSVYVKWASICLKPPGQS